LKSALFDHISLGVSSLERSAAFYDAVLAALGHVRLFKNIRSVCYGPPGFKGEAPFAIIEWGKDVAASGPGFHVAFAAQSRAAVDQFHKSALETGGVDQGPPGIREDYDPGYYAAFVRDPDGHRLEAVLHEPSRSNVKRQRSG
jgi:catechol 2,3-dioxygenase-like lactoylglutathione lyase family enzyme